MSGIFQQLLLYGPICCKKTYASFIGLICVVRFIALKKSYSFAVNSMFYSTLYVKRQIEELGLLVKIAFVGDHFEEVVEYLSNESKDVAQGTKSFLLFHYSPSLITNSYNLTTIKFDPCHQPWTAPIYHANRSVLTNCLYEYNRFAKVEITDPETYFDNRAREQWAEFGNWQNLEF